MGIPIIFDGREVFANRKCEDCTRAADAEINAEKNRIKAREMADAWNAICPPIYRDTNPERLHPKCMEAAASFDVDLKMGLGLTGSSGLGKTRALFLALKIAFDAQKSCASVSHAKFSRIVQEAFAGDGKEKAEAKAKLESFRRANFLLIDDLGKPPSTERADSEIEDLIEHRTSFILPILWSANGSGAWLEKRFGSDRGEPIVRRLSEFSRIVPI